ncbi:MAG: hypothetical protein KF691_04570 [Phycisphaeraceae bacterium]|nr:hypothetical protein [Phycisphaeraceae bacterium]
MKYGRMVVCGIAASVLSMGALAQDQKPEQGPGQRGPGQRGPGEGGPRQGGGGMGGMGARQLSPERAAAAWNAEATGVASRVGLNAEQTKATVAAYVAARESQRAIGDKTREEMMQKARDEGPNPEMMRDMMKKIEEVNASEREKLQQALTTAIGADATAKVMPSLGLFSRQWDSVVDVFSTFKLESAANQTGLNAIEEYAISNAAAQAKMREMQANRDAEGGQPDREGMRAAAQEGRQKLIDAMKPILNKEQLTKLEEAMPGAGRGGPGGGRRGGGGS